MLGHFVCSRVVVVALSVDAPDLNCFELTVPVFSSSHGRVIVTEYINLASPSYRHTF